MSGSEIVRQRVKQSTTLVQLIYQDIYTSVKGLSDQGNDEGKAPESQRKESFD